MSLERKRMSLWMQTFTAAMRPDSIDAGEGERSWSRKACVCVCYATSYREIMSTFA